MTFLCTFTTQHVSQHVSPTPLSSSVTSKRVISPPFCFMSYRSRHPRIGEQVFRLVLSSSDVSGATFRRGGDDIRKGELIFLISLLGSSFDNYTRHACRSPSLGPSYLRRRDLGGVVTISSSTPPPLTSPLQAAWK